MSLAATEHRNLCRGQMDWMETDTRGLLEAGVDLAGRTWEKANRELGWVADEFDVLVLHQVSMVHTMTLLAALGLDPTRTFLTFPEFGNIGSASVPITMAKAVEAGRVEAGSRCAWMGIGSGLNCSFAEILW